MTPFELRQLEIPDLRAKVDALTEELFRVKFQKSTAQLADTSQVSKARKTLARAKTILRERELAEQAK